MKLLSIDPGNVQSAWVLTEGDKAPFKVYGYGKMENEDLLEMIDADRLATNFLAIEMIASYGMGVGQTVFETCVWIGRFIQAFGGPHQKVYRREVKLHLTGSPRAKDGNVRLALIDLWGGQDIAVGKKGSEGPLYGMSKDVWQALGVAVTFSEGGCK